MANEEIKGVEETRTKPLLGKVVIQGIMRCETGLHIGTSQETLEIGRMEALVQRNPFTKEPYVPGSSLKGKMRYLLERMKQEEDQTKYSFNRQIEAGRRHECDDMKFALDCEVCRLFGSTGRRYKEDEKEIEGRNHPARLIVRDLHFTNKTKDELNKIESDLLYTERKWENTLDRITAAATPRQIERVPAGSEFFFELIYAVEIKDERIVRKDLENILCILSALQFDALGGHGSRGYGKVSFRVAGMIPLHPDGTPFTDGKLPEDSKSLGKLVYDEDSIPKGKEKDDYKVCPMDLEAGKKEIDKVSRFFSQCQPGKEF